MPFIPLRTPLFCEKHQKRYVRFESRTGHSWGCPVCVWRIREDVRKLRQKRGHWLDRLKGKTT